MDIAKGNKGSGLAMHKRQRNNHADHEAAMRWAVWEGRGPLASYAAMRTGLCVDVRSATRQGHVLGTWGWLSDIGPSGQKSRCEHLMTGKYL